MGKQFDKAMDDYRKLLINVKPQELKVKLNDAVQATVLGACKDLESELKSPYNKALKGD